jgi:Ca2+-binding RTX toxin-like protein
VYGEDGADTIDAQRAADRGGDQEHIFGGTENDTIAAADGVKDLIDCGEGVDTVVSHDPGLDELVECETTIAAATTAVAN